MRVLALTDYYPPHAGGGVEVVSSRLSRGLVQRGHAVRVLTVRQSAAPAGDVLEGAAVDRAPGLDLTARTGVQGCLSPGLVARATTLARDWRPDVVHLHSPWFPSSTAAALAAAHRARAPLLVSMQMGPMTAIPGRLGTALRLAEARVVAPALRRADRVVAVSPRIRSHLLHLGVRPERITVIPNGVSIPAERAWQRPPGFRVLFAARLIFNKGPADLLHAIPALLATAPHAEVLIAGDGPQRHRLEALAAGLGIAGRVRFLGYREDFPALLATSHVFVRPSLTEGVPLGVLQALAAGVPVIATDVAGTGDVVRTGVNGELVPPGQPALLGESLVRLATDPCYRDRLAQGALASLGPGDSWDAMTTAVERAYDEALHGTPAGTRP